MTSKEWMLENIETSIKNSSLDVDDLLERWGNHKTKELEAKILSFRNQLNFHVEAGSYDEAEYFLQEFDNCFNITTEINGAI
jgi:hypothetical protein